MDELNKAFDEYVNEFKKLDIPKKRDEVIFSIKELIAGIEYLSKIDNIKLHYLKNNEIKKSEGSEDEFLLSMLVYIEVAKNLIGEYLLEKENNNQTQNQ